MFRQLTFTISTLIFFLALSSPAYAYLDAGTGSMLLQLILGGLAGIGVIGKLYWHRLTGFFKGGKPEEEEKAL